MKKSNVCATDGQLINKRAQTIMVLTFQINFIYVKELNVKCLSSLNVIILSTFQNKEKKYETISSSFQFSAKLILALYVLKLLWSKVIIDF